MSSIICKLFVSYEKSKKITDLVTIILEKLGENELKNWLYILLLISILLHGETKDFGDGLRSWNKIMGTATDDFYTAGDNWNAINLYAGDNFLQIGDAPNSSSKIEAGDGSDKLITGDGWDSIDLGSGDNNIKVANSVIRIDVGDGNDKVIAGDSVTSWSEINLGGGDNTLSTGINWNKITAKDGNNFITTDKWITRIDVGDGDNRIITGDSITNWSEINLGSGKNSLVAGDNWNRVVAKDGDDEIILGKNSEKIVLGGGDDKLTVDDSAILFSAIYGDDGDDIISAGKNFNRVELGNGDDKLAIGDSASASSWTKIDGEDGDDTIYLCENWKEIQGGDGDDTVIFKKSKESYKYEDKWGWIFLTDLDTGFRSQLQKVEHIKYDGDCKFEDTTSSDQNEEKRSDDKSDDHDKNQTESFSLSFKIVDYQKDENITTKIIREDFKLDILVFGQKYISDDKKSENEEKDDDKEDYKKEKIDKPYRYNGQMRWNDGKKFCENRGMQLPTIEELKNITDISHGEYWTNKEISSSWAYMFRPPNWTQSMQKINYKNLYCVASEENDVVEKLESYRYDKQIRWNEGKEFCKNRDMRLPTAEELERYDDLPHGEYWTSEEISTDWVYMFRPPNWKQSMQKINYKNLYCVSDSKKSDDKDEKDDEDSKKDEKLDNNKKDGELKPAEFNGTIEIYFVNSSIPSQKVQFNNENKKTITLNSGTVSKNIGVKIVYDKKNFYSEDNFSVRPYKFEITIPDSEISGKAFDLDIYSKDRFGNFATNYTDSNSSGLNFKYLEVKPNCLDGELNISKISIVKGKFSESVSYSEIGEVNISISEKEGYEFAEIDSQDGSGDSRFINSDSVSIDFNLSKIKLTSSLTNFDKTYTYIGNDLNKTKASLKNMIDVFNAKDKIVHNFSKSCYSQDLNLTTVLKTETLNRNLILIGSNFNDIKIDTDLEKNILVNLTLNRDLFVKGSYLLETDMNFKRETNNTLDIINLEIVGSNILLSETENFIFDENISTNYKDANFYFARVIIDDVIVEDGNKTTVKYLYEVYLSKEPSEQNLSFGDSNISSNWYHHLDLNRTKYDSDVSLGSNYGLSLEIDETTIYLKSGSKEIEYDIHIDVPQYFVYNRFESEAHFNSFGVQFNKKKIESEEVLKLIESDQTNSFIKINPNFRTDW